jgi:hypothetical protein
MNLAEILDAVSGQEEVAAVIEALSPYIPAIQREGWEFANEVVNSAVAGEWTEVDRIAWAKMTDDERDQLSNLILKEARDAVARIFKREKLAKEVALKVAIALVTVLLERATN